MYIYIVEPNSPILIQYDRSSGMLVESMAAKAGALHGLYQDATPFTYVDLQDDIVKLR